MAEIEARDRGSVLDQRRTAKMAASAHAYVRGATALFYEWLAELPNQPPQGPAVWICGGLSSRQPGAARTDSDGRVEVQIRDLDQTVIGNPAHDLIRLGLSLASAARGSDLPGVTTARMIEEMVRGYGEALADPEAGDVVPEPQAVSIVKRRALGRRWRHLARERLNKVAPRIPLGSKFWALEDAEREALEALFARPEVSRMVLDLNAREHGRVRLIDAAYWMKGCSSLGKLRYAALIGLDREDGDDTVYALVDLKEAVESVAPAAPDAQMPSSPADRVVAGARALSPNLGDRMMAASLLDRSVVVRELAPQDLKLEIDQFTRREAARSARYLAYVVGRGHARQMDDATREGWRRELERHHHGDLEAPNWLWATVVALAGRHEQGYLEHCRRYALEAA